MLSSMSVNILDYIPEWVPPYTLRYSKRARHLNLKICSKFGFQIIVPYYCEMEKVSDFLHKHREWIEKHWRAPVVELAVNPEKIMLSSINEIWSIEYISNKQASAVKMLEPGRLLVSGRIQNHALVKRLLKKWIHNYAEQQLISWFERLSGLVNLSYSQISIGNAVTLWGSCSAKKAISLNCKLLFLPRELVEYVMLHELCHTIHLNHSKEFWNLLERFMPGCLLLRKKLHQSNHYIPAWFE